MKQKIGNVGLLDLRHATEESIKGIESINNVGVVFYHKENAHLLSSLSIGNIGKSIELPEGCLFVNGSLKIDDAFLQSLKEERMYFVNGAVIISKDVTVESLSHSSLSIQVNGAIYCPTHLSGVATGLVTGEMVTYENDLPRFEAGDFSLTNAFLQSLDQPQQFVILGVLRFPEDLNMELFMEKITKLEVKGVVSLHEQQESFFHKKVSSLLGCVMEVIPAGYQTLKKTLRLNGRSIRRFKCAKLYTKKPIILDHSITREAFSEAIDKIHTKSIIICPEHLEDLIYETCNVLDTEVIPFVESFLFIEGEEHWSEEQISALDKPINLIVKGLVTFSDDVTTETLKERIAEINLFGEIRATNKKILGALQSLLVINHGEIKETGEKEQVTYLDNIGELSL